MANKKTHDVVAVVGRYTDASGAEKKRYLTVGSAFVNEHGRISIKLDALPVGEQFSGWFQLYDVKKEENQHEPW